MYEVRIDKKIQKKLDKLNEPTYSKIKTAILNLRIDPRPFGSKKLTDRNAYRIRVGNYRIIYEILDNILLVYIIDLGHRKAIYR